MERKSPLKKNKLVKQKSAKLSGLMAGMSALKLKPKQVDTVSGKHSSKGNSSEQDT